MSAHGFVLDTAIPSPGDNRRQPRRAVTMRALMRNRSAAKFDIRILDLSVSGFRAEAHYGLDVGDIVWVKLPGLQGLEANIAWRRRDVVGGYFRQPLHPAVLDHIVANSNPY